MRWKGRERYSSPKGGRRGCLCWDTNTYSKKCCDGHYRSQGIGSIHKHKFVLFTENREEIVQEDGNKLFQ